MTHIKFIGIKDTPHGKVAVVEWGVKVEECGVFSLTETELENRVRELEKVGKDATIERVALAELRS